MSPGERGAERFASEFLAADHVQFQRHLRCISSRAIAPSACGHRWPDVTLWEDTRLDKVSEGKEWRNKRNSNGAKLLPIWSHVRVSLTGNSESEFGCLFCPPKKSRRRRRCGTIRSKCPRRLWLPPLAVRRDTLIGNYNWAAALTGICLPKKRPIHTFPLFHLAVAIYRAVSFLVITNFTERPWGSRRNGKYL